MKINVKIPGVTKFLGTLTLLLFLQLSLFAQQKVTGTITAEGKNLAGVVVKAKNGTAVTQTDEQGNFTIEVADGATLILSYIGFENKEVKLAAGQQNLRAELQAADNEIEEVA